MKKQALNPRSVALIAVMTAVILIVTAMVQIPTQVVGYIHLGDAPIFFAALAFGPWIGGIAAALGTALADIYTGYGHFAWLSFLVHGCQAILAGLILHRGTFGGNSSVSSDQEPNLVSGVLLTRIVLAVVAGCAVVVVGYYLGEIIMVGAGQAVLEIPLNIVQSLVGGVLGILLYLAVLRAYPPLMRR